jgi:uncharacterized protein with PIN domain
LSSRIEEGFRWRFRDLLALVQPRRLDFGVDLLLRRGRTRAERQNLPLAQAFAQVYEFTRQRVQRRLVVTGSCSLVEPPWDRFGHEPPRFLCDAGLGGLARWLRAAGYEARWAPDAGGGALVGDALQGGLVLLTTDSRVMERRVIRDGSSLALWLPSTLTRHELLTMVFRDLGLSLRAPRCMACGGELVPTPKQEVAPRIPPRTARWKDDYFVCARCDHLFWQGTHWERIETRLQASQAVTPAADRRSP